MTEAELRYVISVQDRELKQLKAQMAATGKVAEKDMSKGFLRSTDSLKKMNRAVNIAGGVLLAGLVVGLKKATDAAKEEQVSKVKLSAQLKALGINYEAHAATIDKVITKQSRLAALDDEDLQDSFTTIVRVTGDVNKALEYNALAADIARGRNMDLGKAGELVAKVAGGNTSILKRYGIVIEDGATAQEALAALQEKFAGQAEAYGNSAAGASDRAAVAAENYGEKIGKVLLPMLTSLLEKGLDLLEWTEKHKTATKAIVIGVFALVAALKVFVVAMRLYISATTAGTVANKLLNAALHAQRLLLMTSIVGALILVGVALVVLWKKSETFRRIVYAVWNGFKRIVVGVWKWIKGHWPLLVGILLGPIGFAVAKIIQHWDEVKKKTQSVWNWIGDKIRAVLERVRGVLALVRNTAMFTWNFVRDKAQIVVDKVQSIIQKLRDFVAYVKRIPGLIRDALGKVGGFFAGIASKVVGGGDINIADLIGRPNAKVDRRLWPALGIAHGMGLTLSSSYRPGATVAGSGVRSDHSYYPSKAIDIAGPPAAMRRFALMVAGIRGVETVIHSPIDGGIWMAGVGWTNLRSAQTRADHYDHVHVDTFDRGGWLPPRSATLAINRTSQWEPVGPPGAGTVVFNFPNYVGDRRELARAVRDEFDQFERRNRRRL